MIDTTNWKEFKVGVLFDIHPTKNYGLNNSKLFETEGDVPVVVNSSYNNGVGGYVDLPATEEGNIITFSDTTSSDAIFYQPKPFIGYSHVQGMYPRSLNWSEKSLLFFLTIFKKAAINNNFDYVNKFNRENAKELLVPLPIDSNGQINYKYMEDYINRFEEDIRNRINLLNNIKEYKSENINISNWKKFHLYDLFEIESGSKLDRVKMKENNPTINFVGRSGINNGVTAIVDRIDGIEPYKAGYLTLSLGGAYLGSCFVQSKDFYTSQNVVVLIPKVEMNIYVKQFIASIIFKEGNTHYKAFIDELNKHIKKDFEFPLPVTEKGNIDYNFMEKYIKSIPFGNKI